MNIFNIASIIGALAWVPPLIYAIRSKLVRSKILVNTAKTAEVGFSSFGPIINLRIAFSVEHKDIVISELKLNVRHELGEKREYNWQGIVQNLGRITNPGVGSLPYEKENNVLAIKLNTKEVDERFIRFQDEKYLKERQIILIKLRNKIIAQKNAGTYNPDVIIQSEEFDSLNRFNQQSFCWKPGLYNIKLYAKSNDQFNMENNEFSIRIDEIDVESMHKNIEYNKLYYENELKSGVEGYEPKNIEWNWISPDILKE